MNLLLCYFNNFKIIKIFLFKILHVRYKLKKCFCLKFKNIIIIIIIINYSVVFIKLFINKFLSKL